MTSSTPARVAALLGGYRRAARSVQDKGRTPVTEREVRAWLDGDAELDAAPPSGWDGSEDVLAERVDTLAARFGLDDASRRALMAMAAAATHPLVHELAAESQRDPIRDSPSPAFWSEALGEASTPTTLPGGALAEAVLIAGPGGRPVACARDGVALIERIARWLGGAGAEHLWRSPSAEGRWSPPSEGACAQADRDRGAGLAHVIGSDGPRPFRAMVWSEDTAGASALTLRLLASHGAATLHLQATEHRDDARVRGALRDARALGATLVLEGGDAWFPEHADAIRHVAAHQGSVVIIGERPLPHLHRTIVDLHPVHLPRPAATAQVAKLAAALGGDERAEEVAGEVAPRFSLTESLIDSAAQRARAAAGGDVPSTVMVTAAIRSQIEGRIGDYAEQAGVGADLEDLALEDDARDTLAELIDAYRLRDMILDRWGFSAKIPSGRAITALFHGPPGTGKTSAAGIVARSLGTDLFKVDLSRVVDKYIGQTEKHLARIFDEAERSQVVLLFDEADSLFSKRTEVSRSTDRYANLQVNFLLQRIETHDGLVILTTNNAALIDDAFSRRVRYKVEFPMPGAEARGRIWRQLIPSAAPIAPDVSFEALGERFEMSGGHIRNAILRAAYLAAEAGDHLDQAALMKAAVIEYQAMGRAVREWADDT